MKLTLIFVISFSISHVFGQTMGTLEHENRLLYCLSKSEDTTGCLVSVTEELEKDINKWYEGLFKMLNSKDKARLKASQKAWLKHRELDTNFLRELYSDARNINKKRQWAQVKYYMTKDRWNVLLHWATAYTSTPH